MKTSKNAKSTVQLVLSTLRKSETPLSAYDILDKLRKQGVKSPPLVYRALDKLIDKGSAHRIDTLSSYVACNCEANHSHELSVITVCGKCHQVKELHDDKVIHHLEALRDLGIELTKQAVVELPVICANCTR